VEAAVGAVVDPSTPPVTDPPADWSEALRAPDVIDRATASPGPVDG
jgi:hypothetical protein